MANKVGYLIVALAVFLTSYLGSIFTTSGMSWYQNIIVPEWTPPGFIIGIVWTGLFILMVISGWILLSKEIPINKVNWLIFLAFINLVLNIGWSFFFFYLHRIGPAVWEAVLLDISIIVLIVMIWSISRLAASLLIPYAVWVAFATWLTYNIYLLNK